ncbi:MAG: response regulator [Deltaproteobacteria bacterium]|nr:response regulator [Deltaproteobacteria bacterium]
MTDLDVLRRGIRELFAKRERGDLTGRRFQSRLAEETVALFRAAAREAVSEDESFLAQHHVAHSHLRLARSVLEEPEEEAVSLFVTERSLIRVRAVIPPSGEAALDPYSVTRVDVVPLGHVRALRTRREIRWSEVAAGAVIACVAFLAGPWLLFTGKMMILLGAAGVLHGLLLPATWVEVELRPAPDGPPFRIFKRWRKSGRAVLARLRGAGEGNGEPGIGNGNGNLGTRNGNKELGARNKEHGTREGERGTGNDEADEERVDEAVSVEDGTRRGAAVRARRGGGRRTQALLVDDDDAFREALVKVLGRRDIDVTCAADGELGLAALARDDFDVVVLDLAMPGLDGLQVLERLRARRLEVPVVMLTGHGSPSAGLDAMDLGAVDFLLKPISPDRLALAIETAVRRDGGGTDGAPPEPA